MNHALGHLVQETVPNDLRLRVLPYAILPHSLRRKCIVLADLRKLLEDLSPGPDGLQVLDHATLQQDRERPLDHKLTADALVEHQAAVVVSSSVAVQILEYKLQKPFISKNSIIIFERTMMRSEILQTLAAHRDELPRMGVKTLAVFGSVARDEARSDSGVDILVEFWDPATFNGYMDHKFFLEDLLGRPVDLVTRKSIRPRLKPTDRE